MNENTNNKINLNAFKFSNQVQFNSKLGQEKIKNKKHKINLADNNIKKNDILKDEEIHDMLVHFGEDVNTYVDYNTMYKLILSVSQQFESDKYNQEIADIRDQIWLKFAPLIDNMPTSIFNKNRKQYFKEATEIFNEQLKD